MRDESEITPGNVIRVQKATFEHKNKDGKSNNGEKKKKSKFAKKQKRYNQEKELSWDEDDTKHVVIKNMFDYRDAKVRYPLL